MTVSCKGREVRLPRLKKEALDTARECCIDRIENRNVFICGGISFHRIPINLKRFATEAVVGIEIAPFCIWVKMT